jgi:hypothetical protein
MPPLLANVANGLNVIGQAQVPPAALVTAHDVMLHFQGLLGGTGDGCALLDLGTASYGTQLLSLRRPTVDWFPCIGYAQPNKRVTDLGGGWVTALLYADPALGINTENTYEALTGLNPSNGDMIVLDNSQHDGGIFTGTIAKHDAINVVHTEECDDMTVALRARWAFDLERQPGDKGWVPGIQTCQPQF